MTSKQSRKEAVRQFKEQKAKIGIYAVRSAISGNVWIGGSKNLDATQNSCWFTLRIGSHLEKSLQREWNAQGESDFSYEVLEVFPEDLHPLEVADTLKARKSSWVQQFNAQPLL